VTLEEVRARFARIVGRGDEVTAGEIPFTPRVKKVLELALREALHLGHNYIGPEHILLGLVREGEGVAARILLDFDATPRAVAEKVLESLGVQAPETYLKAIERPWRERPARAICTEARAPRGATLHLVAGWLLFVVALGIGILLGWAIWG
jgi:ATP-dependent Clp protease ATP-binding subunit ClpA